MKILVAVIATAAVATGCSDGGDERPAKAPASTGAAVSTYSVSDYAEAAAYCQTALNAKHAGARMAAYPVAEWQACLEQAIAAPGHGWG